MSNNINNKTDKTIEEQKSNGNLSSAVVDIIKNEVSDNFLDETNLDKYKGLSSILEEGEKTLFYEYFRLGLINKVRNTDAYKKYNGPTLPSGGMTENRFLLLIKGIDEIGIIDALIEELNKKILHESSIPVNETPYFNPATGIFDSYCTNEEKTMNMQNLYNKLGIANKIKDYLLHISYVAGNM